MKEAHQLFDRRLQSVRFFQRIGGYKRRPVARDMTSWASLAGCRALQLGGGREARAVLGAGKAACPSPARHPSYTICCCVCCTGEAAKTNRCLCSARNTPNLPDENSARRTSLLILPLTQNTTRERGQGAKAKPEGRTPSLPHIVHEADTGSSPCSAPPC